ncbi:MAG: hypothetical protein L6420_07425 [Elusimicrobia bacterium]|nr:hypothetical protein [Elusimicrobiota bacterium]
MSRIFEILGRFNPFNSNKGLLFFILKRESNQRQNRKAMAVFPPFLFSALSPKTRQTNPLNFSLETVKEAY